MARIYETGKSTLALRQRKRSLFSQLKIYPDSPASLFGGTLLPLRQEELCLPPWRR